MNKNNLIYVLISLITCCWTAHASHAMTWQELNTEIHNSEAGKEVDRSVVKRLISIVDTVVVYTNEQKKMASDTLLFCVPESGQFNLDEITSLIRAQARKVDAPADESVAKLLIDGFRNGYPCEN